MEFEIRSFTQASWGVLNRLADVLDSAVIPRLREKIPGRVIQVITPPVPSASGSSVQILSAVILREQSLPFDSGILLCQEALSPKWGYALMSDRLRDLCGDYLFESLGKVSVTLFDENWIPTFRGELVELSLEEVSSSQIEEAQQFLRERLKIALDEYDRQFEKLRQQIAEAKPVILFS